MGIYVWQSQSASAERLQQFIAESCEDDAWVAFSDDKMLRYRSNETSAMQSCTEDVEVTKERDVGKAAGGNVASEAFETEPHVSETELPDLVFAPLAFQSCYSPVFLISPRFSFGMEKGILCHCGLGRCNLFF